MYNVRASVACCANVDHNHILHCTPCTPSLSLWGSIAAWSLFLGPSLGGEATYWMLRVCFTISSPLRVDASQHTPGSAVYVGFDPTADSLHTGNLMAIMALLHFRHAGYQPVAVVRDAILLFLSSLCHISSNYI